MPEDYFGYDLIRPMAGGATTGAAPDGTGVLVGMLGPLGRALVKLLPDSKDN